MIWVGNGGKYIPRIHSRIVVKWNSIIYDRIKVESEEN